MNETSVIIEKVQKLLALSSSKNANEAAAATLAANRLIDKYRLSEIDLESKGSTTAEPIEDDHSYIYETGRVNPWKYKLVTVLASHYGLAHFNDNNFSTGRKVSRFRLIGRRSDITIAKYMFNWLAAECQRLADLEAKGKGHIYVASYCFGFVNGIAEQLKISRKEVQVGATQSAIVKMDDRGIEAKKWMDEHFNLHTPKTKLQSRIDSNAFNQGKLKGERFHLGATMSGVNSKLLN